jgi:hypothetical protein
VIQKLINCFAYSGKSMSWLYFQWYFIPTIWKKQFVAVLIMCVCHFYPYKHYRDFVKYHCTNYWSSHLLYQNYIKIEAWGKSYKYCFKIHFNIIYLCLGLNGFFSSDFQTKILYAFPIYYACYMLPSQYIILSSLQLLVFRYYSQIPSIWVFLLIGKTSFTHIKEQASRQNGAKRSALLGLSG